MSEQHTPIEPIRVGELPAFLKAVTPIMDFLAEGEIDLMHVLQHHASNVIDMVAIGARIDRVELEQKSLDELVELAGDVISVNADFFIRQVVPAVEVLAAKLADALEQKSEISLPTST